MTATSVRSFKGIRPSLGDHSYIDVTATVIGDVVLGENSSVWPLCAIRGDVNSIRIGERCNIQDGTVIHVSRADEKNPDGFATLIGDDVTIGHKALLHGCTIGNRVLVGMGSIVLDGVTVEDDVMIGAGTLVTPGKTLASGFLYTGSPAKPRRALSDNEKASMVDNAAHYVKLKDEYL